MNADPLGLNPIDGWISDFLDSTAFRESGGLEREPAERVLCDFFAAAIPEGSGPDALDAEALHRGYDAAIEAKAPREPEIRQAWADCIGAFLRHCTAEGRLADGDRLASDVRSLVGSHQPHGAHASRPFVRPAAPPGRNDPCPCGSGRKYKKCCG